MSYDRPRYNSVLAVVLNFPYAVIELLDEVHILYVYSYRTLKARQSYC